MITPYEASGQSRLTNEFEILKSLGKGGFGDVIKVREALCLVCPIKTYLIIYKYFMWNEFNNRSEIN